MYVRGEIMDSSVFENDSFLGGIHGVMCVFDSLNYSTFFPPRKPLEPH